MVRLDDSLHAFRQAELLDVRFAVAAWFGKNVVFTMRFVYGHLCDGFVGVFAGEVARSLRFLAWVLQGSSKGLCIAEVSL